MCYLFPTARIAKDCQAFLKSREPEISSRTSHLAVPCGDEQLHIYPVFMQEEHASWGKQFWQHTGDGISSRFAARCLSSLKSPPPSAPPRGSASNRGFARNKHYAKSSVSDLDSFSSTDTSPTSATFDENKTEDDPIRYVEERYGRNLARRLAPLAKVALRRRIAGVLQDSPMETVSSEYASTSSLDYKKEATSLAHAASADVYSYKSSRIGINEDDVYLYSAGMSAIYHSHKLAMQHQLDQNRPVGKSICFGFPYTDTLKILQKWGPGCIHFGNGLEEDLDAFEELLKKNRAEGETPFLSVFTEFPSNPLLRSSDLKRLRTLANEYGFLLVVDETIGTFVNVEVLPLCDIVVSSLTKVFSGDGNVMGGRSVYQLLV